MTATRFNSIVGARAALVSLLTDANLHPSCSVMAYDSWSPGVMRKRIERALEQHALVVVVKRGEALADREAWPSVVDARVHFEVGLHGGGPAAGSAADLDAVIPVVLQAMRASHDWLDLPDAATAPLLTQHELGSGLLTTSVHCLAHLAFDAPST